MNYIIIPTYNERENIEALIAKLVEVAPQARILVVDDSSPDGTGALVTAMMKTYPSLELLTRTKKDGLGRAYIHAFESILKTKKDADAVLMMDADFSHDPHYIPEMLRLLKEYDVVVASRYVRGGGTSGWELWRRVLSRGGNLYARIITRMPISELTGGFNAIRVDTLKKINFDKVGASGYAFQIELKYALKNAGARFIETPILFKNRTGGESKISNHIISEGILAPWKMIFRK